jgi:hypothetical protein
MVVAIIVFKCLPVSGTVGGTDGGNTVYVRKLVPPKLDQGDIEPYQ